MPPAYSGFFSPTTTRIKPKCGLILPQAPRKLDLYPQVICMKALKGNYFSRSKKAIDAGCNIILKCDYNLITSFNASKGAGKVKKDILKMLYK